MINAISSAVHALGTQAIISPVGQSDPASASGAVGGAAAGGGSFGSALSSAIGSLESSQQAATSASQGLATGTLTDPTQAVTSVENASMAMDLAAQVRDKLTSAENTIFQTQV